MRNHYTRSRNISPEFLGISHAEILPCEMLFNQGLLAVPRGRCLCVLNTEMAPSSRSLSQKNETAHSLLTRSLGFEQLFSNSPLLSPVRCVTAGVVDHRSALVKTTRPSRASEGKGLLLYSHSHPFFTALIATRSLVLCSAHCEKC